MAAEAKRGEILKRSLDQAEEFKLYLEHLGMCSRPSNKEGVKPSFHFIKMVVPGMGQDRV